MRLPAGKYAVVAAANGRAAASQPVVVEIKIGAPPAIAPMYLSPISHLIARVSEAGTPTSSPLPCRLTIVSKPGTMPVDYGFGPSIAGGVKNLQYLPRGEARFPLTPGRYQLTFSRGIEYDIVQRDIEVAPEVDQTIAVDLPRVIATPGMIAADIGVMTSASAVSTVPPRDRVIQAACEGVPILVSGDYDTATDLQAAVNELGMQQWVRAFAGMRFLVAKDGQAADILVYPVQPGDATKLREFRLRQEGFPPDVFLADLRKQFPDLVIQIDSVIDPQAGYLSQFGFDEQKFTFTDGVVPPPDFDAVQVLEGKFIGMQLLTAPRYYDMLMRRTSMPGGAPSLSGLGGSLARLPYGQEVGYPRTYLYSVRDTLDRFTAEDIVQAVRGQHYQVTNGPIIDFKCMDPATGFMDKVPGNVVDCSTTQVLRVQLRVKAAPWIAVSGLDVLYNGLPKVKIEIPPSTAVDRYPVRQQPFADRHVVYPEVDGVASAFVYSTRRSLSPVVPANPALLGGEVYPVAWTGTIFVDKNGDQKVNIKR